MLTGQPLCPNQYNLRRPPRAHSSPRTLQQTLCETPCFGHVATWSGDSRVVISTRPGEGLQNLDQGTISPVTQEEILLSPVGSRDTSNALHHCSATWPVNDAATFWQHLCRITPANFHRASEMRLSLLGALELPCSSLAKSFGLNADIWVYCVQSKLPRLLCT